MAKAVKAPKPRKAWFIVSPSGVICLGSERSFRRDSVNDFVNGAWGERWDELEAKGYRCVRCEIAPA